MILTKFEGSGSMTFSISNFMCPECKKIIPLPRPNTKQRENGHIKDLYCPYCHQVQKFQEYKSKQAIRNMAGEELVYN